MGLGTIYLICAIAGGTVLVLRVILMLIGIDHGDVPGDTDIHVDIGHDIHADAAGHGGGYDFLSIQSIAGFFTLFGLVGMGLLEIHASDIGSLLGALVAGVFTAWCTGMIFFYMQKLQSEGTLVLTNAIGQTGTVYLTIPEKGSGVVNVTVQGATRTLDAVSENGATIPTGRIVLVTGITGDSTLVVSEQPSNTNHYL
jgi:hypothetical protein